MDLVAEILSLYRISDTQLQAPSERQVARHAAILKCRPEVLESARVEATQLAVVAWRERIIAARGRAPATHVNHPIIAGRVSIASDSETVSGPMRDEATIREMDGKIARANCVRLGLEVEPHPTNAGITAMRCKNRLLVHVRHGGQL